MHARSEGEAAVGGERVLGQPQLHALERCALGVLGAHVRIGAAQRRQVELQRHFKGALARLAVDGQVVLHLNARVGEDLGQQKRCTQRQRGHRQQPARCGARLHMRLGPRKCVVPGEAAPHRAAAGRCVSACAVPKYAGLRGGTKKQTCSLPALADWQCSACHASAASGHWQWLLQ